MRKGEGSRKRKWGGERGKGEEYNLSGKEEIVI